MKMSSGTNLLEVYINFVEITKKQKTYCKKIIFLFVVIISLFLIFLFLKYLKNNTFSLEKVSKTGNLYADSLVRRYKLEKIAKFMEINSIYPQLKQSDIAKELEKSSSTIQQNGSEINQLSVIE